MKKRSKILVALLIGTAISLGINATNAEQVVIDGISNMDYNGATFGLTIFNSSIIQENTEFKNNINAAYGSGLTIVSDDIIKDNVIFEANKSNAGGGAIMNYETLNIGKASFTDNSTQGHGVAIYNVLNSSSTISGAKFNKNSAAAYGGAIFTQGTLTVKDSEFTENHATVISGAIHHSIGTLTLDNVLFKDNWSDASAGALFSELQKNDMYTVRAIISNCIFDHNVAGNIGAVGNTTRAGSEGLGGMFITDTIFRYNESTADTTIPTSITGGALGLGSESITRLERVTFLENTSNMDGGAIATRKHEAGNNKDAKLDIIDSKFVGNSAKRYGGAIDNYFFGSENKKGSVYIVNTLFEDNHAGLGGAIFNHTKGAKSEGMSASIYAENSTFTKNSAEHGGAIYNENEATVTIGQGSVFSYNTATKGGGAIKNFTDAILNVTGDVKFIGNVSEAGGGAIQNMGTATLGNDLVFDGNIAKWGGAAVYSGTRQNNDKTESYGSTTIIGDNAVFINNKLSNTGTEEVAVGGAIYVENDANAEVSFTLGKNAYFGNNTANNGGAIFINNAVSAVIGDNAVFENNTSQLRGGAIFNAGLLTIGNNAIFYNNIAFGHGSDINNDGGTIIIGDNAYFGKDEIPLDRHDCAIYSPYSSTAKTGGSVTIGHNATFERLSEAIVTDRAELHIGDNVHFNGVLDGIKLYNAGDASIGKNATFENCLGRLISTFNYTDTLTIGENFVMKNNTNTNDLESNLDFGIIYNDPDATIHFLGAADFSNNSTPNNNAGIFQNWGTLIFDGQTKFINNFAGDDAGALRNRGEDSIAIFNAPVEFIGNKAGGNGGAILNQGDIKFNDTVSFKDNSAGLSGGAIHTTTDLTISDGEFINNTAGEKGGAIFANADLSIAAATKNVVFSGNKAEDGADIFMNTSGSTLTFNTGDDKMISIKDGISGSADKYNIAVNGDGTLEIASYVKNADITVNDFSNLWLNEGSMVNGNNNSITLNDSTGLITINNKIDTFDKDLFTLNGEVDLAIDVDLANAKTDFFGGAISKDGDGTLILDGVNIISDRVPTDKITIDLYKATGLNPSQLSINTEDFYAPTVLTPIRYLQGSVNENGILSYAPTGNGFKDFNPAVMASPVAAQIGGYLTQLNSYDEAFRNMDMYMLMSKEARMVMKSRNKVAIAGGNNVKFDSTSTPYENTAGWVRPYSTFEKVDLRGARKVSNVAYGSFFGGESELVDLGKGWDGMLGVYAGYNGSHQAYSGISTYQNGGTLGVVSMAYKDNFFTGLTLNAGANVGEASTFYGSDNFSMVMAGIASKSGYNIELAEGKLIIQPNFLMSYSFVNTFDYTNSAGVRMDSDPLHAIQIEPGIKLIGNLKNGWQPYGSVSMVWNIMDKTEFTANNISLPELSVKPYVKYGIGVRKTWGERLTGFFQTYFTNGGRTGVGLQAGFRFTFGQGGTEPSKSVEAPKPQKTVIKLGSSK